MGKKSILYIVALLAVGLLLAACAGLQGSYTLPAKHPGAEDLGEQPKVCTNCHEARGDHVAYERFVHTADYGLDHRAQAYQAEAICAMCHQTSFCNECHVTRNELKPSLRRQTDTYRRMPHRGDYLSRHRIDARLDPTSCFRCHGNPKAATTCAPCHG